MSVYSPEIHAIILDEMATLQGESVTGTGAAQRVIAATDIGHNWAEATAQSENTAAVQDKIVEGVDLVQGGYTAGQLDTWAGQLEALNAACP